MKVDKNKELEELESKIEAVRNKIAPLHAELFELCEKSRTLKEALMEKKVKKQRDSDKPNWEDILHCEHDDTTAAHKFREEMLGKMGLHTGGYNPTTNQTFIEVSLTYGDAGSLEKTIESLKTLLPFISPIIEGNKAIGIFEHTLSQYGVYEMLINEEKGHYEIQKTAWHNTSSVKTFKSLAEMIKYVQEHHWYDGKESY